MNRQLTALFAAFEGLLVVAGGIVIPLAPLTILWGAQFGFGEDWLTFWRASVDIWLLGHGVDMTVSVDPGLASSLGIVGAEVPFTLTIAALGIALITVLLSVRAGRRIAETRYALMGQAVAVVMFALASFAVTFSTLHPGMRPSLWQGTLLPTLVFVIGIAIGARLTRAELGTPASGPTPISHWIARWPTTTRTVVMTGLRGGAAAAATVMLAASVLASIAIAASFARIISLYESLHTEVLGGIVVTLGQLAFIPNFVIWVASWLIGPGFALGTGSEVSPLGTQLGPIPVVPVLGALPTGSLTFGFLGLLVPVIAGFLVGAILGPRVRREIGRGQLALVGLLIGVSGGILLGLLAWASAGTAGPGRLATVGPDPWAVGICATIELAIAATIGLMATIPWPSRRTR